MINLPIVLSVEDFETLLRKSRKTFHVKELSPEQLDVIEAAEVPSEYDYDYEED